MGESPTSAPGALALLWRAFNTGPTAGAAATTDAASPGRASAGNAVAAAAITAGVSVLSAAAGGVALRDIRRLVAELRLNAVKTPGDGFVAYSLVPFGHAVDSPEDPANRPTVLTQNALIRSHLQTDRPRIRLQVMGDSYAQGVGAQTFDRSFPVFLAYLLGQVLQVDVELFVLAHDGHNSTHLPGQVHKLQKLIAKADALAAEVGAGQARHTYAQVIVGPNDVRDGLPIWRTGQAIDYLASIMPKTDVTVFGNCVNPTTPAFRHWGPMVKMQFALRALVQSFSASSNGMQVCNLAGVRLNFDPARYQAAYPKWYAQLPTTKQPMLSAFSRDLVHLNGPGQHWLAHCMVMNSWLPALRESNVHASQHKRVEQALHSWPNTFEVAPISPIVERSAQVMRSTRAAAADVQTQAHSAASAAHAWAQDRAGRRVGQIWPSSVAASPHNASDLATRAS